MVAAIALSGAATGPVGTVVTVTGTGFTPSSTIVTFTFNGVAAALTPTVPATAPATGNWTATFVVPQTDQAANPVTVSATDAGAGNATTTYTVTTSLKVSPISGSEDDTVTATGDAYTATDALTGITIGGVVPLVETVTAQTVNANGHWSGTFVVPVLTNGAKTVTATTAADTANATFTISGQSIGPDDSGAANGTANGGTTVTATLTTTSHPDLVVAVVAWQDTGTASVVVTDAVPLVWTARSQPKTYGNFKIQEWTAPAAATIAGKVVTATFSSAISGRSAISVIGLANAGIGFDSNPGLPSAVTASGTFAAVSVPISTHLAPELLFGALVLVPQATITAGAGWIPIDAVNATSFELQTEYQLANVLQLNAPVSWNMVSAAQTAVGLTDGILAPNATNAPWTTIDLGAEVSNTNTASTEAGVGNWYYPKISPSGETVTFNRSVGGQGTLISILGTTTSAIATVLTDTNLALTSNALVGAILTYTSGPAAGQSRVVASNTSDTITTAAFSPAPSVGGKDAFNVTGPQGILTESHTSALSPLPSDTGSNYWPGVGSKTQVASG